jgi:hypothetical protein
MPISAQGAIIQVGNKDLNLMIGMGTPWVLINDYRTILPPFTASLDYGFRDDNRARGIKSWRHGGLTTYRDIRTAITWVDDYGYKSTTGIVALRSTYHYELIRKLDTYGGMHLGMRAERWVEYGNFPHGAELRDGFDMHPVVSLFAGAKYYINDKFAAMAEIGYSIAFVNLGVCIKALEEHGNSLNFNFQCDHFDKKSR